MRRYLIMRSQLDASSGHISKLDAYEIDATIPPFGGFVLEKVKLTYPWRPEQQATFKGEVPGDRHVFGTIIRQESSPKVPQGRLIKYYICEPNQSDATRFATLREGWTYFELPEGSPHQYMGAPLWTEAQPVVAPAEPAPVEAPAQEQRVNTALLQSDPDYVARLDMMENARAETPAPKAEAPVALSKYRVLQAQVKQLKADGAPNTVKATASTAAMKAYVAEYAKGATE